MQWINYTFLEESIQFGVVDLVAINTVIMMLVEMTASESSKSRYCTNFNVIVYI